MTWSTCSGIRRCRASHGLLGILASSLLAIVSAGAQPVTGEVRDSLTGAPLSGAVVLLLGPDRQPLERALTSRAGTFRLSQPRGTTFLRVVRIGYRAWEVAVDQVRSLSIVVAMEPLGVAIAPVVVRAAVLCPEASSGREALALWQSAQDGLLALVVGGTTGHDTGTVHQIVFDRVLDETGRRVIRQSWYRVITGNAAPIRADRDPVEFVQTGYVERTATGFTYFAPDPGVLLDSSFAETHCLSTHVDGSRRPDQIGITFTPTPGRDTIPDIRGVLWLTRAPLTLHSLEFEYEGVDSIIRQTRAGGRLDFQTLANGVPIIRSWHIRTPRLAYLPMRTAGRPDGAITGALPIVAQLHETGGLIASGTFADGTRWSATLASVQGRVLNAGSGTPVPNARVVLDSTDAITLTDAQGRFLFNAILPGPYTLRVTDSITTPRGAGRQLSLDSMTHSPEVVVRSRVIALDAQVDRATDVLVRLPWRDPLAPCYGRSSVGRRFVVVGSVISDDSKPLANAEVRLRWRDQPETPPTDNVTDVRTDARGRFVVCGVPAGVSVSAQVKLGTGTEYTGSATVLSETMGADRASQGATRSITFVVSPKPDR